MKQGFFLVIMLLLFAGCGKKEDQNPSPDPPSDTTSHPGTDVDEWVTSPQSNLLFKQNTYPHHFVTASNSDPVIIPDTTITYQTIDGFGNCLTGGSAMVLNKMSQEKRTGLLKELFATDGRNIGISYLRISIGASDLSDRAFTYDDLPDGQTDPEMSSFSIDPERTDLIPVLKEILAISPDIKILGSPWSAPAWMKTNDAMKGGNLRPDCFDAYARYFVKYIKAMEAEGISIDAITIQNEPLYGGNNPSMEMSAADQALFIKQNLGPAFAAEGITTKIIIYDHNADRTDYPISILSDPDAAPYVDGSAFHLYGGTIDALSIVHNAFPGKNLYFTEQWVGAPGNLAGDIKWHVENLIIGGTRNWCKVVLEWNLASDPSYHPHTDGGCDQCLGTVTIDGDYVSRNPAYYILAHASKFVRPGSVRISSNVPSNLPNVAFQRPDGKKVLVVINTSGTMKSFNLKYKEKFVSLTLDSGAAGTYIW